MVRESAELLRALDSPELRKARGAFFTPPELTDFVANWAVRTAADRVLEPSCGEAAFLLSMGARLATIGGAPGPDQLRGIELHEPSAQTAEQLVAAAGMGATVAVGDFFDFPSDPSFDAVAGNPPFVRYQGFTGDARAKGQQAALAEGVRLPGLASSWAAFVVHASTFLKPDGRLGLVLPAELLTVNYAGPVRRFLMERFSDVRLVLFDNRVFPGVLEEVVLLLAEGKGSTDQLVVFQVRDTGGLGELVPRRFVPTDSEAKWTPALLLPDAADMYATLTADGAFTDLTNWGDPDLGIVTGNNDYFTLTAADIRKWRVPASELLRISPRGSRHLRGLTFTNATWTEMLRGGSRANLFYPNSSPSKASRRYIDHGEAEGVHHAYKCRVRSPWWRVPLVPVPDVFFTYMNHDSPRLVTNRARVLPLNSIHGLRLRPPHRQLGMDLLPIGMLNSLTLLGAELVGRSYGGGILKLEPREADRLPVPSSAVLEATSSELGALRPQLAQGLREGKLDEVVKRVDRVLFKHLHVKHADVTILREARDELFARRSARGNGHGSRR